MKKASEIAELLRCDGDFSKNDPLVSGISCYSPECSDGIVFAALAGENTDGHSYAFDAYKRGSRVFIVERKLNLPDDSVQLLVDDSRKALSEVSLFIYDEPQRRMTMIGVTGTKGKSTVVSMIHRILSSSGKRVFSVGTLGATLNGETVPTDNSTPQSDVIARLLQKAASEGANASIIEVSSQGVKQKRIDSLKFDIGVFTNLSSDHVGNGEHTDFDEYKNCKKQFFSKCKFGVFNADDKYYDEFSALCSGYSYAVRKKADFVADNIVLKRSNGGFTSDFDVMSTSETAHFSISIPGIFAVYDTLAAVAACNKLGISLDDCSSALKEFSVPGRFEKIAVERDIDVVIDYAHNGESMDNALKTARRLSRGRLTCVFGPVGGRTKLRRSALAKAADKYADLCILTSDNPNYENPLDILSEMVDNITSASYKVIPDRADAIKYALDIAVDGDFIIICGKGHEKYQLINGVKLPFDEKEIILNSIKAKAKI